MKMKEVSKRAVALAAATIIGIGTMAGAPVSAKAADNAGIRSFVTRMYEVCLDREPDADGLNDVEPAGNRTGAGCGHCIWLYFQ